MKILQLCTKVPYPPKDGGALGVYVYSKTLVQYGHTVNILAINSLKHFQPEKQFITPHHVGIHSVIVDTNINILKAVRNILFSKVPYLVERFYSRKFELYLTDLIRNYNPDIIQIEGVYLAVYIPVIRRLSNARIVIRCHNIEHVLWSQIALNETNWLIRFYLYIQGIRLKKFENTNLTKADGIITFTQPDTDFLVLHKPELKVTQIPFGVDIENKLPEIIKDTKTIAFIGALDWNPNQTALIWFLEEVWPSLILKFSECIFHIAGRNAPKWLSSKIKGYRNTQFHGEIEDTSVFYSYSNIIVVPLFSASGVRIKIVEGMNMGKVIVASSAAMKGIPAKPDFHYCLADSASEFITKISFLLNADENICMQYAINAKKFIADNYDISVNTKKLIDFYQNLFHA